MWFFMKTFSRKKKYTWLILFFLIVYEPEKNVHCSATIFLETKIHKANLRANLILPFLQMHASDSEKNDYG